MNVCLFIHKSHVQKKTKMSSQYSHHNSIFCTINIPWGNKCIRRHVSGQMSLRKRESCHPLGSGNEVMNLPASSHQHKAVQCVWPHTLHQLTLFSHSRCRQNNGAVYSFWSCSRNGGLKCHRILGIKWTLFLNMSKTFANGTWNENFVRWTSLHLLVKL